MFFFYKCLSSIMIAKSAVKLIASLAINGTILPRSFWGIYKALLLDRGFALIQEGKVVGYAEIIVCKNVFVLVSVSADPSIRNKGIGWTVVSDRIDYVFSLDPNKPIVLACSNDDKIGLVSFYRKFGFVEMHKENAPKEVRHGRSDLEWMASDRAWMMIKNKEYWEVRREKTPITQ
jgi:N-acetylglutamate synthase-like GNAT family acetyltransferase